MAKRRHGAQRIGDAVQSPEADGWGAAAWGLAPWGGTAYPIEELPYPHTPSHVPADFGIARHIHEIEHRRSGVLVQTYTRAAPGYARLYWEHLTSQKVALIETYAVTARIFRYYPDLDDLSRVVTVKWIGGFDPKPERGGRYTLDGEIEEVSAA